MKTVIYTASAIKDLRAVPRADAAAITRKIAAYATGTPQDVTRLKGSKSLRLRHGDWRAIFEESATVIDVLSVKNRKEAYR